MASEGLHESAEDLDEGALHEGIAEWFEEPVHQAKTAICPPNVARKVALLRELSHVRADELDDLGAP